jgi:hypothetical protein
MATIKKPYGHKRFYELLDLIAEIHSNKSHDYGGKEKPLSNLDEFGWKGVIVRLGDKFCRLKNFYRQGEFKVKGENLIDTFMDMAIYSLLGIIEYEQENKK